MGASVEICARALLDTAPAIMQAIRVEMRQARAHELSVPQFRTLAYVARQPGCSLSAVAEFIGLTLPTMSVLVTGLVEAGFVMRQTSLIDRRRVTLTLTDGGAALYAGAYAGALEGLVHLLASLSEADQQTVERAMALLHPVFVTASTTVAARAVTST